MSEILKKIKNDLKQAMTAEVRARKTHSFDEIRKTAVAQKTVSRAIISMFPEIGKKPADATDEDVIKLVKKYINNEKERQLYIQKHLTESDVEGVTPKELKKLVNNKIMELGENLTSVEIMIAQIYLPVQATEEEIVAWIEQNLDLSSYKNKMQAMKPIMENFKGADGNFVKNILLKF